MAPVFRVHNAQHTTTTPLNNGIRTRPVCIPDRVVCQCPLIMSHSTPYQRWCIELFSLVSFFLSAPKRLFVVKSHAQTKPVNKTQLPTVRSIQYIGGHEPSPAKRSINGNFLLIHQTNSPLSQKCKSNGPVVRSRIFHKSHHVSCFNLIIFGSIDTRYAHQACSM